MTFLGLVNVYRKDEKMKAQSKLSSLLAVSLTLTSQAGPVLANETEAPVQEPVTAPAPAEAAAELTDAVTLPEETPADTTAGTAPAADGNGQEEAKPETSVSEQTANSAPEDWKSKAKEEAVTEVQTAPTKKETVNEAPAADTLETYFAFRDENGQIVPIVDSNQSATYNKTLKLGEERQLLTTMQTKELREFRGYEAPADLYNWKLCYRKAGTIELIDAAGNVISTSNNVENGRIALYFDVAPKAVKTTITFKATGEGGFANENNGYDKYDQTTEFTEGDEIKFPETRAAAGHELKCWRDESGNEYAPGTVIKAAGEAQIFTAVFVAKTISVTFKIDPTAAGSFKDSGKSGWTLNTDGSYTYAVAYKKGAKYSFPSVNVNRGYSTGTWTDADGNKIFGSTSNKTLPTEDVVYTYNIPQAAKLNVRVQIADSETGDIVLTPTSGSSYELNSKYKFLTAGQIKALEESGYQIPEGAADWKVQYNAVNTVQLLDAEGNVLDTAEYDESTKKYVITYALQKKEAVKTTITFKSNGNGGFPNEYGGFGSAPKVFADLKEGTEVTVPEVVGSKGYELAYWKDQDGNKVNLGKTVTSTDKDQTYTAYFQIKTISVTFRVFNPEGGSFKPMTSSGWTANEDGSLTYTKTWSSNGKVTMPTPLPNDGWQNKGSNGSYWADEEGNKHVYQPGSSMSIPENDETYTFVYVPSSSRNYAISYTDEAGNEIYSGNGKVNYKETVPAVSDYARRSLDGKGYEVAGSWDGCKLTYPAANVMNIVDAEGNVVLKGKLNASTKKFEFTIPVTKKEAVKTTISFDFGAGGSGSIRKTYTDVVEGEEVDVPEPTPIAGYEFTGWTDSKGSKVELGATVKAAKENQSYKANFIGKEITITWKATVPGVVQFKLPTGSRGKDMTILEDGSVQLKTRYSSTTRKIYFPTPTITDEINYEKSISISGGKSHWSHGDMTISWTNFTLKHTDDGDSYTLVVMPKALRYYNINYVNEAGDTVYSPYTKVNYQDSNAVNQSYTQNKLNELGYEMTGNWADSSVVYDKAGLLEIRDKDGNVLATAVQKENKPNEQVFTIPVQKSRFSVSTTIGDGKASVTEIKRGEDFELNLNEIEVPEGKVISQVLVDEEAVTPEDGKVILDNVTADHTVNVQLVDATLDLDVAFMHAADGEQHLKTMALNLNEKTPVVTDADHEALAEKGYGLNEAAYLVYDREGHITVLDASGNPSGELAKAQTRSVSGIRHEVPVKKLYKISHAEAEGVNFEYPTFEDSLHAAAIAKGYNAMEGNVHAVKVTPAEGYTLAEFTINGTPVENLNAAGHMVELTGDGADIALAAKAAKVQKTVTATFDDAVIEGVENGTVTAPEGPARDGYEFAGWKAADGTLHKAGNQIKLGSENLTFQSTYLKKVTVSFGDTTVSGLENDKIKVPEGPVKDGWTFIGWKDMDGSVVKAGEEVTLGQDDLSYTAVYEKADDDRKDDNQNKDDKNNTGDKKDDKKDTRKPAKSDTKASRAATAVVTGAIPAMMTAAASLLGLAAILRRKNRR